MPRLQRLDPRAPRRRLCPRAVRRSGSHVGHRVRDRGDRARRALGRRQRADAAAGGDPELERSAMGADVGRDRRDRSADRDAPGHRAQHDLLPRMGEPHREPPRDAVDGAPYRGPAQLRRGPRAVPGSARRVGRGQRGLDGLDDGHARRVLPRPSRTAEEAAPPRAAEPLPPPAGPRDLPARPGRDRRAWRSVVWSA